MNVCIIALCSTLSPFRRRFSIGKLLLGVVLLGSLLACSDHRPGGPLSPVWLRLKTVTTNAETKTYGYDGQSLLSSIARPDGSLNAIAYGDPDGKYVYPGDPNNFTFYITYPNPDDQTTGSITLYPLNLDGTSFTAGTYPLVNSKAYLASAVNLFTYSFDATKHLTNYSKGDGRNNAATRSGGEYTYTGENITDVTTFSGRTVIGPYLRSYDDKINPFFGLLDPDVETVQLFSRNNVIRNQLAALIIDYSYEYNAQNLPTKLTSIITGSGTTTQVTTYTYESY